MIKQTRRHRTHKSGTENIKKKNESYTKYGEDGE